VSAESSEPNGGGAGGPAWPWPDALDALQAAPRHHRLVIENERVRVLETRIPAGETTAVHTHRWPAVSHLMSWSDFIRRDGEGRVLVDTRGRPPPVNLPQISWLEALPPHSLENVGGGELLVVSIELKDGGHEHH
jgi:hypothetical protein